MVSLKRQIILKELFKYKDLINGYVLDIAGPSVINKEKYNISSYISLDPDFSKKPTVVGVAEKIPFANNTFDCVLFLEAISWVQDPLASVQEAIRVLKPGGYLFLSTHFIYPVDQEGSDNFRYTKTSAINLLKNTKIVKIKEIGYLGTFLCSYLFLLFKTKFLFLFNPLFKLLDKITTNSLFTTGHLFIITK